MARVYNFSAGPAMIPEAVLQRAKDEMLDWQGSGMSVMEMSHRGKEYTSIAQQAEADFRELLTIPSNYKVLFLQGGASSQFAMIPMNLLRGKTSADYINTGEWSKKAIQEAQKYCTVNVVASAQDANFTTIPARNTWKLNPDAAYFHYTPNETIGGLEFQDIPDVGEVPLIADMSSNILSRPLDVSKFGLIYAGAQKNIGPAGMAIVIIREDLIGQVLPATPTMFDYKIHADNVSMYNTPPTYTWYLAGLVFKWLKELGGLTAIETINRRKAEMLYTAIDQSSFYNNPIDKAYRSWMNIPFTLADSNLDKTFLEEAKKEGLIALAGHRLLGGMRASIYNAMPEAGVKKLVDFMADFEKRYG